MSCRSNHVSGLPACYVLISMSFMLLVSGCQQTGGDTLVLHEDISVLQYELASREVELMQLHIQLQNQEEAITRLSSSQEQAVQEVVRAKAMLRSHAGKAETVANIAEVSVMLQSYQGSESPAVRKQLLKRADQYLTMSEVELDKENYEGAAYLVGKARALVQTTGSSHGVIRSGSGESEVIFFSPIRMKVVSVSNVREQASLQAKVLFRLDDSVQVRAIAYKGPWLRIKTGDGRMGWIYYKLVALVS